MVSAVLLTGDIKLEAQIEQWIRQSLQKDLTLEAYESFEAFKEVHLQPKMAVTRSLPASSQSGDALQPTPETKIGFFIVDIDVIVQQPIKWIAELQKFTHEKARNRIDAVPRVMIMAYEGGTHRLESLQHESVDDLVLKPLDKTSFLQKCEFMLANEPKAPPTFLFTAKGLRMIEVGRDVMIDEISEYGVSVRSPGPLPDGAFASIHCDAFGTKLERRLIGRVYESVRHPVREGEYLARFSYFGISADQLSAVRRFIRANHVPLKEKTAAVAAEATATASAATPTTKPTLSKALLEKMSQIAKRQFAVIDVSGVVLEDARSILETSFKGVGVRKFTSYARFLGELNKLIEVPGADPAKGPPVATPGYAFPSGKINAYMRVATHDVVRFEPGLSATDKVLGAAAPEWIWKNGKLAQMVDPADREAFDEFMRFVGAGMVSRSTFRVRNAAGQTTFIDMSGTRLPVEGEGELTMRIEMREVTTEAWATTTQSARDVKPEDFRFEAIIIDGRFLLPNPQSWYEGLVALMQKTRVLGPKDAPPRIFVIADPSAATPGALNFDPNMAPEAFRFKGFADYSYKPIDRRSMILKFLEFCPNLLGLRETGQSGFVPCELTATMGKDVLMDELGEYGLSILHPTAFKERSFMRFYSQLFGEGGEWLTGRCRYCEVTGGAIGGATTGGQQHCTFHFFGASDSHLQKIRLWIREDYVAGKEV